MLLLFKCCEAIWEHTKCVLTFFVLWIIKPVFLVGNENNGAFTRHNWYNGVIFCFCLALWKFVRFANSSCEQVIFCSYSFCYSTLPCTLCTYQTTDRGKAVRSLTIRIQASIGLDTTPVNCFWIKSWHQQKKIHFLLLVVLVLHFGVRSICVKKTLV